MVSQMSNKRTSLHACKWARNYLVESFRQVTKSHGALVRNHADYRGHFLFAVEKEKVKHPKFIHRASFI